MLSPASFIDPTINSNVVMNIRFYIMLPLVCLSLFGCSKQEPTIERPFDYPFCEWQGELKDGKPNGKGFGGCVVGQERPGVGFYSAFKTLKPEQCDDESDRCQCERFWRGHVSLPRRQSLHRQLGERSTTRLRCVVRRRLQNPRTRRLVRRQRRYLRLEMTDEASLLLPPRQLIP